MDEGRWLCRIAILKGQLLEFTSQKERYREIWRIHGAVGY